MIFYWGGESSPQCLYMHAGVVFTALILCYSYEPRWGQSVNNEASPSLLHTDIKEECHRNTYYGSMCARVREQEPCPQESNKALSHKHLTYCNITADFNLGKLSTRPRARYILIKRRIEKPLEVCFQRHYNQDLTSQTRKLEPSGIQILDRTWAGLLKCLQQPLGLRKKNQREYDT